MQTTHRTFVNVTKQIGGMRYMLFLEGITFLVIALFVGKQWGVPGMVTTSIGCTLAFTYQYSIRRTCRFFQLSFQEVALNWVKPSLKLALILTLFAMAVWPITAGLPNLWRLTVHAALAGSIGSWLLLRIGLRPELLEEAGRRLPPPAARLLQRLVPCER
jgi:hypothetical protein